MADTNGRQEGVVVVKAGADFSSRGLTGLNRSYGLILEDESPLIPDLSGRKAIETYKNMRDNEPIVGAALFAVDMLIRQAGWRTEPYSQEEDDVLAAEFLQSCIDDMSITFSDVISEINSSKLPFGWAYMETLYKRRVGPEEEDPKRRSNFTDGLVGWRKFELRAPDTLSRWVFDSEGGVIAMVQNPPPDYRERTIPIQKACLFRTSLHKNNPEGRALDPSTLVPTPDGWRTMGDLVVGDQVFGADGKVRYVAGTADWEDRPRFCLTFNDGSQIIADAAHEWATTLVWERAKHLPPKIRTTTEIAATVQNSNGVTNHSIGWARAVHYPRQDFLVPPYVLGQWLGDGTTLCAQITSHVDDVPETVAEIEMAGYPTKVIHNGHPEGLGRTICVYGGLASQLRALDLLGNKHIPPAYLRSSADQRLALLAGLLDADGSVDADGRYEFVSVLRSLADGVAELVRSLGGSARVSLRRWATQDRQTTWAVRFTPTFVPFRLGRKIARCRLARVREQHYVVSAEPLESGPTKCIEVDAPDHLYLCGESFIPTHNSVLRTAYRPWYYKRRIEEIEGVGIERDLAGLPRAYVPPDLLMESASADDKAILEVIKTIITNVRRDAQEGVIFPAVWDENGNRLYEFDLLNSGGSRQFDTTAIIERYVKHIAMTIMADFMLLGHEGVGSFALSSDKTNLFSVALGAWMDMDVDVLNRYAVPRLFRLNGLPTNRLPKIVHGDVEDADLAKIASFIASMVAAGMPLFPDEKLQAYLRQVADLPEQDPNANPQLPTPTLVPSTAGPQPEADTQPPQGSNAGAGVNQ